MKKIINILIANFIFASILFAQPTIINLSPVSGAVGTAVTITGTNFSSTIVNNIVWFGGVKAIVTSATATSLTTTVPVGATHSPIRVLVNGLIAESPKAFNITFTGGVISTASIAPKVDFSTGSYPSSVSIGDLDGDGKLDMAVVNYSSNTLSVYRNTSATGSITSSSFGAKVDFATGDNPSSVSIGDLDGDGKLDMAVENRGANTVSVFRNTSTSGSITSSSFATKVDFVTGSLPSGVSLGDIDGDGKLDMAVVNSTSQTVSVFRNTSTSGTIDANSFATKVDFATGVNSNRVSIGDLDGDGKLDMAVTDYNSNTVSVFRNTSTSGSITTSSFAPKVDFATGLGPSSVSIGDLDGDGKLDMAVVNWSSNTVSVYRNTSTSGSITSSSFEAKIDFVTGLGPRNVSIGDLDGDGKLDMAVVNIDANTVSVFRNTSATGSITSSSFGAKVDFATGVSPISVSLGDLDGDGKLDMAVANHSSNTVSVFRNIGLPPTITNISPTSGPIGTTVTITGTNFTGATAVSFGGTAAASYSVVSATSITAVVASGTTGTISVITPGGTATSSGTFTFIPPPTITSFTPTTGGTGLTVTITGTNFTGATAVTIGGTNATSFTVVSATSITAVVASGTTGTILITTPGGTASSSSVPTNGLVGWWPFTGNANDLSVNGNNGTVNGATLTADRFGVVNSAYSFDGSSNKIIAGSSSTLNPGIADFSISGWIKTTDASGIICSKSLGDNQQNPQNNDWYVVHVNSGKLEFELTDGYSGPGDYVLLQSSITINDGAFHFFTFVFDRDGNGSIYIDNVLNSSTSISGFQGDISPLTHLEFGYDTEHITNYLSGVLDDINYWSRKLNPQEITELYNSSGTFTFIPAPTITSFTPTTGATGTTVTITGTNFTGATAVSFGGTVATSFTIVSATSITAVVATGTTGTIAVTTAGGTTTSSSSCTFIPAPTITSFTPTTAGAGATVTITGNYFIDVTAVKFGGTAATSFTVVSATNITAIVGSGTSGSVSVTTPGGTATSSGTFTFIQAPAITSFTPTTGGAGTTVTITGTNFTGATAVKFGGTNATSFTVVSATSITAVVASGTTGTIAVTTPGGTAISSGSFYFTPTIINLFPTSGPIGSTVIIKGTNFATNVENNLIWFGGVKAKILFANSDTLKVIVPIGATHSPIRVLTRGLISESTKPFYVTYSGGEITSNSMGVKLDFVTGLLPTDIYSGDLDSDGKIDIVLSNSNSNTVSIYRNTSSSEIISFATKIDLVTGSNPNGITLGDLDGNGKLDIVVANEGSNSVSVFKNTTTSGTISFAQKVDFVTGSKPIGVSLGDMDNDGKLDIVLSNWDSKTVSIFRNRSFTDSISTSSFATKVDLNTGNDPWGISLGDLDGDGKLDIAAVNSNSNTVSVFKNKSTIGDISASSFATKLDFTTGSNAYGISLGDLDGDGKLDMAVSNLNSNSVSVFRNITSSGNINFDSKIDFTTGFAPYGVTVGDIDGDGKLDMAVINWNSNTVSVFRNTSTSGSITTSSFATKVDFATGSRPYGISLGDLDGDGKLDMAVTNYDYNTVSVLRNYGLLKLLIKSSAGIKGRITPLGESYVFYGDSLRYNIRADLNYYIDSLIVDGSKVPSDTIYTFRNITSDHSIRAVFRGKPKMELLVTQINFGSVKQTSSKDTLFNIKNIGTDTLKIYKIWTSSILFTVQNPNNLRSIAPNNGIVENIKFTPTALGQVTGKLYLSNNSDNQEKIDSVNLSANVVTKVTFGTEMPTVYSLSQNYPNPFNPTTTIRFGLPNESYVTLEIYNSLGQLVQTLVNEVMSAHYYEVKWEAGKNPTGLYFYKIIATDINNPNNKLIQTRKMMLVK